MTDPLFTAPNPDARLHPGTCSHTWDPVYTTGEGFNVIRCGGCDKVLSIKPKENHDDYRPPTLTPTDATEEARLLHEYRKAQAQIRHPSRS